MLERLHSSFTCFENNVPQSIETSSFPKIQQLLSQLGKLGKNVPVAPRMEDASPLMFDDISLFVQL